MTVKLNFDPKLPFQLTAIDAVVDLFRGQEICRSEFTVMRQQAILSDDMTSTITSDLGIGNRLLLLEDEVLKNLNDIQLRNGLAPSPELKKGHYDFTVEMETGTGKTYVYLRTMLQLNREYGFTKFMIVVPSVAIKEGVLKSLEIMMPDLNTMYSNVINDQSYFPYDSSKISQVRNFATSPNIQIMVVTVGAINKKDVNNLYKNTEKVSGEKPIDLIKATNPIIIVDEPQSVDGGLEGRGKEALSAMNPMCTLRYSATHADKHHMVYRLDAVDAYNQGLVKQIEVAALNIEGGNNKPYIKVKSVTRNKSGFAAKLELDVQEATSVNRKVVTVKVDDNLETKTKRAMYSDYQITEMSGKAGEESVSFMGIEEPMYIGESMGGVDSDAVMRMMIKRTILEHLEREKRLLKKGIKVLSLFFIEKVDHYRVYDKQGNATKGKLAKMFEKEMIEQSKSVKYKSLFEGKDLETHVEDLHNGYFSIDKKGGWAETSENNQTGRDNAERAYNLIMKDKEKLLSIETPLKFIFSHSALKEGWDNPNVFQICTLREIGTERERRQTIGRGLRLCVNQQGDRLFGSDPNTLTVVATESYEQFAENLQKEIEKESGIRFGFVEKHQFASITYRDDSGEQKVLGVQESESLWNALKSSEYITDKGKVTDQLRKDLKEDKVTLPKEFIQHKGQIVNILTKLAGKLDIKNADENKKPIKLRRAILEGDEFQDLWNKIKQKTTYRVDFADDQLEKDCSEGIANAPAINRPKAKFIKADIEIDKGGVSAKISHDYQSEYLIERDIILPDILTELQDKTQLTRKSISKILKNSGRLSDFTQNPQQFIEIAVMAINKSKQKALVDGVRYKKRASDKCYTQELFSEEELGNIKSMMLNAERCIYEHVKYDSDTERKFAEKLEKKEGVKVYAKLPNWFKIPTPLGNYNPDWAVLLNINGEERLYFVVETKSTDWEDELRSAEVMKINCGKAHFDALAGDDNPIKFIKAKEVEQVFDALID